MCCIFTCCGWMIDLVQRAWVFTMSCCISSAVCCFLMTASMSGVALGYNYSLAEYIELKETNVSVYLKRGVFDDEVVDEMDWRRGGGGVPSAQRSGAESSEAPASVPDFPFGYRKANDEGMFATTQLNKPNDLYGHDPDHNRFEGSLLKLTSRPKNVAGELVTQDPQMDKIMRGYPQNSLEQLKAAQGLMNRRKMEDNSGENKGFVMPNSITDMTGRVTQNAAGTTPVWGVSEELQLIQKLLNERKEAAMSKKDMRTTKQQTSRPLITGPVPEVFPALAAAPSQARRMGELHAEPETRGRLSPVQRLENSMQSIIQDSPKWYYPKTPVAPTIWTSFKGPVTIHNFVTHTKLKLESTTPLSQENFRRAMQDQKENEAQSTDVNEPPNEPQKDYDEEDVKGIPIRRKRKKRNRRNILDSPTKVTTQSTKKEPNTDIVSLGNQNSVFRNLMAVLMNFKLMFATESADAKVLPGKRFSETLPKASSDIMSSTDSTAPSYINVGASSTEAFRALRIIKSSVAAF